ncbi:NAD-dependent epimerase/dehydratase family protein [Wenzhouxiangella sp. XN79A]|uniref:NAD-dependent epimerase/dehydratase family protein n=1 Tax=Wenzhouxiangella sp. XN79A TaxID=2724193 RepID=UPI00144AE235|nr:NAD-dependent epimerase/dehydratase family protein [Wenzhouxiangella sp. XN79A]NKI36074.1 NAD-dependent epimerase/dehydratase family protein [Wenzhouxiangella sp. XN79A]
MNILVTGGGGFLGQAVVQSLLARGHTVATLNRSAYPALDALEVEQHRGDIADAEAVNAACRGRDAVIHVAAKAGPGLYAPEFVAANVVGTGNVVDACRKHGVGLLVHTSSPSVVHAGGDIEGGDESLPLATHHPAPYPATKAEAERIALGANGSDLRVCALRPHLIWGPGDNHLLPRLIARNRAGRLKLPAPEKKIDTVYIDNAAEAHVRALDDLAGPARSAGRAYFITNDEPRPVVDILRGLLEAAGETPRIGTVNPKIAMAAATVVEALWRGLRLKRDPPISRFVVDHLTTAHWFSIAAAKRDLDWAPAVSMDEGLARLARSARD